jgi:hypothetical protein
VCPYDYGAVSQDEAICVAVVRNGEVIADYRQASCGAWRAPASLSRQLFKVVIGPLLAERSGVRVCPEPPIVCCAAPMDISDIENAFDR